MKIYQVCVQYDAWAYAEDAYEWTEGAYLDHAKALAKMESLQQEEKECNNKIDKCSECAKLTIEQRKAKDCFADENDESYSACGNSFENASRTEHQYHIEEIEVIE